MLGQSCRTAGTRVLAVPSVSAREHFRFREFAPLGVLVIVAPHVSVAIEAQWDAVLKRVRAANCMLLDAVKLNFQPAYSWHSAQWRPHAASTRSATDWGKLIYGVGQRARCHLSRESSGETARGRLEWLRWVGQHRP